MIQGSKLTEADWTQASKPYNNIGMHFVLNSSITTSTDANYLPTFP